MPKLLIVDDETDVREFAGNFFRKRNVEVFVASTTHEAEALILEKHPDLTLLDIRLEEESGLELLRRLRAKQITTRIIMVSGLEDEAIVKEAAALGAVTFIHKPLVLEELQGIVLAELGLNP